MAKRPKSAKPNARVEVKESSTAKKASYGDLQPTKGKLGVMIPGMGAVATTFVAGVEAVRKGIAKPIGSLTQMGTIRLGKRTEGRSPKDQRIRSPRRPRRPGLHRLGHFRRQHVRRRHQRRRPRPLSARADQALPVRSIKPRKAVFDHNYVKKTRRTQRQEGQEQDGSRRAGARRHPRIQEDLPAPLAWSPSGADRPRPSFSRPPLTNR